MSLASVSCKMLEHIIHSNVIEDLDHNNIIADAQHGFRSKRSCETQLIKSVNDLAKALNYGEQIDFILQDFFDFILQDSFDKVSHGILCLKLQHYRIGGNLLKWLEDFLYNRTQKVVVSGEESPSVSVTFGVPQGPVLGPLLFLIYTNNLVNSVSSVSLFADDSYVYKKIRTTFDYKQLQKDLDNLMKWGKE